MKFLKESVSWDYFDKFEPILDKYLPDRDEGDTRATQAVTAVNKLIYKWYNDGDIYDNTYFLEGWGNDLSSYANWLYEWAPNAASILKEIEYAGNDNEYENILKRLADLILNEDYLTKLSDNKISSIYEEDGPFKFSLYTEDDDYGYDDESWD